MLKRENFYQVNSDQYGNSRYVLHFLEFLTEEEKENETEINRIPYLYQKALKRARKFNGRKFHNKQFSGGIVFLIEPDSSDLKRLNEFLSSEGIS